MVANDVNALGTGDITDNATLALNAVGDFDNAISGSGKWKKSGDDALTLSGSNTYTGGTLISSGALVASARQLKRWVLATSLTTPLWS